MLPRNARATTTAKTAAQLDIPLAELSMRALWVLDRMPGWVLESDKMLRHCL